MSLGLALALAVSFQAPPGWRTLPRSDGSDGSFGAVLTEGSTVVASMKAEVRRGPPPTPDVTGIGEAPGEPIEPLEIDGLPARRATLVDGEQATVAYVVAGDGAHALIGYRTTAARLPELLPSFDASARATRGLPHALGFWQKVFLTPSGRGATFGFIGAALALVLIRRAARRRASVLKRR